MRSTPPDVERRVLAASSSVGVKEAVDIRDVVFILLWVTSNAPWHMQKVAADCASVEWGLLVLLSPRLGCMTCKSIRSLSVARKVGRPCCDTVEGFLPVQLQFFLVDLWSWLCSTKTRLWTRRLKSKLCHNLPAVTWVGFPKLLVR